MLLLIDNYDSFTFNLVQYFYELGQTVKVINNDSLDTHEMALLNPSHLIISPGPKSPMEAGNSLKAIDYFKDKIPILGVCLGHQCLAQAFGAKIIRAPTVMHGKTSAITHQNERLFHDLPSPFQATRYHSLVADPLTIPSCLVIDAWAENVIMALSHRHYPLFGLQFHPESILTEHGLTLLRNFINAYN